MGQNDQGLRAGKTRYQAIPRVLVFLRNGQDVLLLKGAPSKRIWANLYNGVGGHVEVGEDIYSAARRELREETGLETNALTIKAVVNIDVGDPGLGILMFVFTGWCNQRKTVDSGEGKLKWISSDQLPLTELVEDLSWLLPRVLEMDSTEQPIYLHYSYDRLDNLVIRCGDGTWTRQSEKEPS
jgi:8-oxo-dGTP diphosphatase